MGTSLTLVVPAEDESLDTVKSYLRHKRAIEREFGEDPESDDLSDHPQYRVAREHLPETFILTERVLSWVFEAMDTSEFYAVLRKDGETEPIHGDKIESLIRILRKAERNMPDSDKKRARIFQLEKEAIGLCRFALKNGYEIELSY